MRLLNGFQLNMYGLSMPLDVHVYGAVRMLRSQLYSVA